ERVRRQSSGHTQSVAALVACNSSPCFWASNAVDLSAIVTLARESLLRSGDDRVGGLVGVTVLIGVGIAVSARVVITRVVCVRIAVIPVSVVIIGIPVRPPWIESEVKDDAGAIDESAMMPTGNVGPNKSSVRRRSLASAWNEMMDLRHFAPDQNWTRRSVLHRLRLLRHDYCHQLALVRSKPRSQATRPNRI